MKNIVYMPVKENHIIRFWREPLGVIAKVFDGNGQDLGLLPNTSDHSPTGFEFGYGGSGPAALAYAILDYFFGKETAQSFHQSFKWQKIAVIDQHTKDIIELTYSDTQETVLKIAEELLGEAFLDWKKRWQIRRRYGK